MMNMQKHKSGFTLIELMLVVFLISVLTMVGMPAFRILFEKSELKHASSTFTDALRYAQQRAIQERIPTRVVIDVRDQRFYVPVLDKEERRHYTSRRRSRRSSRSHKRSAGRSKERYSNALVRKLPKGFIFEFVYKVAEDKEIRRDEGEITFYPDGTADQSFFTLLRLANKREDEQRVFVKISATSGMIKTLEGQTERDGTDFYMGYYDEENVQ